MSVNPNRQYRLNRKIIFGLAIGIIGGMILWRYGPVMRELVRDRERFQLFVDQLGWFGPIALVFFNALQIVVAPIPGYIVQLAAGFLYGPVWGGVWSTLGLFAGSMSAMWLARTYGRPLVERVIGAERLLQWEKHIHSESVYIWFILLLGPTGDAPFYLAGLSQVRFVHIALITLLIRVPSVFVAAAVGAGVVVLTWWQFTIIFVLFGAIAFTLLRHKETLSVWIDRLMQALIQPHSPTQARSNQMELSTSIDE